MKFYNHYKNKPYKFIGIAKHSETLEDVVIYECRYENSTAKLWVRPKNMFFEKVQVGGELKPRFAEVPIQIKTSTEVTEELIKQITPIMQKSFKNWDDANFRNRLKTHERFCWVTAQLNDQIIGFKLGYALDKQCFYSWLGGVLPEYRDVGVANALMHTQHAWCQQQGYQKIQTKTHQQFREMLILNLRHGFEITGTQPAGQSLKIQLEKKFSS